MFIKNARIQLLIILFFTALAYVPSLKQDFVSLDDDELILDNELIKTIDSEHVLNFFTVHQMGHYLPLTTFTYALNWKIAGENPFPYKLFNLIIHLLNVLLVFTLLKAFKLKHEILFFATIIFALHPMNTESIAWISARSNLLCSFFYLIAVLLYVKNNKSQFWILVFFILALLSKSAAIILPVFLLAIDWYRNKKVSLADVLHKWHYFAISFVFGVIAILMAKSYGSLETTQTILFWQKPFLSSFALLFYVFKFFIPIQQSAIHFNPKHLSFIHYGSLVLVLAGIILGWVKFKKNLFFLGLFWFIVHLILVLQILSIGHVFATERYVYLPYIGFALSVGILLHKLLEKNSFLLPLLMLFLCAITSFRNDVWTTSKNLYADIIHKYPEYGYGYYGMGLYYLEQNNLDTSAQYLSQAIFRQPYFPNAYLNRSSVYTKLGEMDQAMEDLDSAITQKPDYAEAYFNKGMLYNRLGKFYDAKANFEKAIEQGMDNKLTYYYLANACYDSKMISKSIGYYNKAIVMDSTYTDALLNRGNAYFQLHKLENAETDYLNVIHIDPKNALSHYNLGNLYHIQKKPSKACEMWRQSVKLGYDVAKFNLNDFCLKAY